MQCKLQNIGFLSPPWTVFWFMRELKWSSPDWHEMFRICWSRAPPANPSWPPTQLVQELLKISYLSPASDSSAINPTPRETWAWPWRLWGPRSSVYPAPLRCTGSRPPPSGRELTGWEYLHRRKRPAPSRGLMKISRCKSVKSNPRDIL